MATWYKIGNNFVAIHAVQVDRATPGFVFIGGRQCRRITCDDAYFETWEEARGRLVERSRGRLQLAEAHLRRAQNDMKAASELARPRQIEFGISVGEPR